MKLTRVAIAITSAVAIAMTSACSRPENADSGIDTGYLTIKGSDTMVHLVSNWAETYMNESSDSDVSVTGGGSGTGIAALINGTADVAMASRRMKQKEYDLATERGIDAEEIVVARDGIAMIVNPANPVNELTIAQLGDIFAGKISNWKEVGGANQPIALLSRDSSSGTYVFVQERVLEKRDYAASARLMPATSGVVQAVSTEEWAIGYVGLGYASGAGERVKTIAVKDDATGNAVLPSVESVQSGAYPIARPLHLYTKSSDNKSARAFIEFCLSPKGQQIVAEAGYVPVNQGTE